MSDKDFDPSNVVDRLTERFGTQARLAEAAGCTQSTISERRKRRSLTHRQMRRILENAPDMGVAVSPDDFFVGVVAEPSCGRGEAAA